jgi:hypothetical protein
MNSLLYNNLSLFIKGLPTFTMVNLFNFTQNLMKHKVNWTHISVVFVLISKDSEEFTTFFFPLLFQDGPNVQALSPLRLMTSVILNFFIIFFFFEFQSYVSYFCIVFLQCNSLVLNLCNVDYRKIWTTGRCREWNSRFIWNVVSSTSHYIDHNYWWCHLLVKIVLFVELAHDNNHGCFLKILEDWLFIINEYHLDYNVG